MRNAIISLAVLALSGCGPSPVTQDDAQVMRTRAGPGAVVQCSALGFTPQTPMPLSRCVESSIASSMEEQVPWPRLMAAGMNYTGSEEMEAIARCISSGTSATSAAMPACFEAQRLLAIRDFNQRSQDAQMRAAQIRAMSAPVRMAPQTCFRNGTVVNCF